MLTSPTTGDPSSEYILAQLNVLTHRGHILVQKLIHSHIKISEMKNIKHNIGYKFPHLNLYRDWNRWGAQQSTLRHPLMSLVRQKRLLYVQ
jgi:hypothetical protein